VVGTRSEEDPFFTELQEVYDAFGAEEVSRIPVPDGRLMSVHLRIGDGLLHLTDEFPETVRDAAVQTLNVGGMGMLMICTPSICKGMQQLETT
jgi:hypothetical protein